MKVAIRHYAFPTYEMQLPLNWLADPYKNKNWRHHLNSLRWLSGIHGLVEKKKVLVDFYRQHCVKKKRNPFYSTMQGDHTAAIRVDIFLTLKRLFLEKGLTSGVGICNRLLQEELKNLQRKEMYRTGHNHGMMVDLAILEACEVEPNLTKFVDIDLVLKRSSRTLGEMWSLSGYTKEHSISYQEYNLPLTISYFEKLVSLGFDSSSFIQEDFLKNETKRILGYSLRASGEYFPVGDSFRQPNRKILRSVYPENSKGIDSPSQILAPYSMEKGCVVKEGLVIRKWQGKYNKLMHIIVTCGWNSFSHKQNDEFSFCFDVDGVPIFDDAGYSTACSKQVTDFLKSENAHSNFSLKNYAWSDKKVPDGNSILETFCSPESSDSECGIQKINMQHGRFSGLTATRDVVFNDHGFRIIDGLNSKAENSCRDVDESLVICHRFVLSPDVSVEITDDSVMLKSDGVICSLSFEFGKASVIKIPWVSKEKHKIFETNAIQIVSQRNVRDRPLNYFSVEVLNGD
ncbi:heparinase II/III domain-containing protein [Halomonas sp. NPDC076908]|uniref:heparinase II/III domain-containing protein n=1 Tax=Halomonas sp. NPDC076908 TaxID=3390567 RepID=UPI003D08EEB3